jgi:hypothetical protein
MMGRYPEADLNRVKRYSVHTRASKVKLADLARVPEPGKPLREFLHGLPDILKARDLKSLAGAIVQAKRRNRPVILMMGAHPVKCGLSPVVIDLVERGFITAVALNGAGAIHDFELACWGKTSEDVAMGLDDGSFGMAAETADLINGAVIQGDAQDLGFGESLGLFLDETRAKNRKLSLLASCYRLKVPVSVHVGIGTDIIHQHPSFDGAAAGRASHRDFRILSQVITELSGGVVLNIGSSVVLPEVFLKALNVARNLGRPVKDFTAANFDMVQHYRPTVNVVQRPVLCGGKGYSFTGHHEFMVPLLAAMAKASDSRAR